jgi:multidrug efflux system membrane fusion protein
MAPLLVGAAALVIAAPTAGLAQSMPGGVPVQVARVTRQDVKVTLRNIGTVQALNTVLVRARVDGTLDRVDFTEGQEVKAGDLLAQIDPRPFAATYAQAVAKRAADEAQLVNLRRDYARYSNLAKSDFASRQSVDTQSASVDQQEAIIQGDDAAIASAKLNLDFASIHSPIDGRVGLRQVDPGNLIHSTDTSGIVTVTQIKPIAVIFTLPQDTLPRVQAAMARGALPVEAYTGDDKTLLGQGQLLTIDNSVDPETGTIRLKATFPNAQEKLWPGQFVNARLDVETLTGALAIPSSALEHGPNGLFVYLVKPDDTVAMQPIDILQDDGTVAIVTKGLDEGDTVVTDGQSRLQAGTKIAPTQKAAS